MLSRRELLVSAAAAAALKGADTGGVLLGCQTNAWPVKAGDWSSVLEAVGKIKQYGFDGFETGFANVRGQFGSAASAKADLEKTGLRFLGVHIFLTKYDPQTQIAPAELIGEVAKGGAALGAERLILSGGPAEGSSLAAKVKALNNAAEVAGKYGIALAYHNHGAEFASGGAHMDALMSGADSMAVSFLLDAGHAALAGVNVPSFFERHHRRISGIHMRDIKGGQQVPLGSGDLDLNAMSAVITKTGWRGWLICEEERIASKPGDDAVAPAANTIQSVFGKGRRA